MWLLVFRQALSLRQPDAAGGDARSGGAKPLPGPSYEQMDITVSCFIISFFFVLLEWLTRYIAEVCLEDL
jgi:hypothetical protein